MLCILCSHRYKTGGMEVIRTDPPPPQDSPPPQDGQGKDRYVVGQLAKSNVVFSEDGRERVRVSFY